MCTLWASHADYVRRGERIDVYLSSRPHNWRPLVVAQDQCLSGSARDIVCYALGAHFSIDCGECTDGVCLGEWLIRVPARVEDGMIIVPTKLPHRPE